MTQEHLENIKTVHEYTGTHKEVVKDIPTQPGYRSKITYCEVCGILDSDSCGIQTLKKLGLKSVMKSKKNLNSNFGQVLEDKEGRRYFYWQGTLHRPSTIVNPVTTWARGLAMIIECFGKDVIKELPSECKRTLERMKYLKEFAHLVK